MRRYVSIALVASMGLALAACGKKEEPAAEATAAPSEAAATASAAAGIVPDAGNYAVSDKDGKALSTVTINADGTYRQKNPTGLPVAGLWKVTEGKTCFDPSGDAAEVCYTDSARAADGSFTATMADGTVLNVKPVAK